MSPRSGRSPTRVSVIEELLEFAPDACVAVDESGTIVLGNHSAEDVFGYPRRELVGRPIEDLVPERFGAAHVEHRAAYFDDPRRRPMGAGLELFGRRRDRSEFPAEISLSAIESEDGPLAIAAVRDISERVEAERERRELEARLAREAERAQASRLESIGQLAGGIAHDFNNLLAVIVNYADFALDDVDVGSRARDDVAEIRKAAERAAVLTRQLLTFSRRQVVEPVRLDLNEVVHDMERLLRRTLGEHIELAVNTDAKLPAVLADPGHIEQVLVNLAVNARDAMQAGGTLTIATASEEIDEEFVIEYPSLVPGPHVRLTVADTGSGMTPEVRDRALEPFFSTKAEGKGTGLGLATVYGIVRQAGGMVHLYSEPERGTVIRIHLPAVEGRAHDDVRVRKSPSGAGTGERILVVEDEDGVRTVATRILDGAGYEVRAVGGGEEALDILTDASVAIDLLLTDVVMPGMPGTELVVSARELRPDLAVLYMSGYIDPLLELGPGEALVEKPFTGPRLLARVGEALGRE